MAAFEIRRHRKARCDARRLIQQSAIFRNSPGLNATSQAVLALPDCSTASMKPFIISYWLEAKNWSESDEKSLLRG